jgi:anti-sigma B factor antagonist
MFDIRRTESGDIQMSGRLDASQAEKARAVLRTVEESCVIDFTDLEYISSLGLGVLLEAQKRLRDSGGGLRLRNLSEHLREVFHLAGFDNVFEIE